MARARREADKVRQEIVEGIFDYADFQAQMADEAARRRKDEDRRRAEAMCGTVCADIPTEFLAHMRPRIPATYRPESAALLLN